MGSEATRSLLLTVGIGGHDRLFQSCVASHAAYAERNRFEHVIVNRAPRKMPGSEAAWLKLWLIAMALARGYDWVAYLDADCEIRPHAPLCREEPLFHAPDKSVFMAPGSSGRFNSGVIFVRNTPEAREFFRTLIANANRRVPAPDRAPYENGHVIHYANRSAHVGRLPHRHWNNNSSLDPASFVQHYSTGPLRAHYFSRIGHQPARLSWPQRLARKWHRLTGRADAGIREKIATLSEFYPTAYPQHFAIPTAFAASAAQRP